MFKRLIQAATITFLLNLLASMSPTDVTQPAAVSPPPLTIPNLVARLR